MDAEAQERIEGDRDAQIPASEGNKQRQKLSRLNITHPVQWTDTELEDSYNVKRGKTKNRKSALKKLHEPDD